MPVLSRLKKNRPRIILGDVIIPGLYNYSLFTAANSYLWNIKYTLSAKSE